MHTGKTRLCRDLLAQLSTLPPDSELELPDQLVSALKDGGYTIIIDFRRCPFEDDEPRAWGVPVLLGLRVLLALWFPASSFDATVLTLINGLKALQRDRGLTDGEIRDKFSLTKVLNELKMHKPFGHSSLVAVLHIVLDEVHELATAMTPKLGSAAEEPLLAAIHRALLDAASRCSSCMVIPTYAATMVDSKQLALQSSGFGRPDGFHLGPLSLASITKIATPTSAPPDFWIAASKQTLLKSLGGNARAARYLRHILAEGGSRKPLDDVWKSLASRIGNKFNVQSSWSDPLLALLALAGFSVPARFDSEVERVRKGGVTDVITSAGNRFLSCPPIILFATFLCMKQEPLGGARRC